MSGLFVKCGDDEKHHAKLPGLGQRWMSAVPLDLKRQHAGHMFFRRPFAPLLDRLTDQPQNPPCAPGVGVQLDSERAAILILLWPNAMVAARKPVDGLCDLDQPKLLHAVRARVFLDQGGDGEMNGKQSLGLDAGLSQTPERNARPGSWADATKAA